MQKGCTLEAGTGDEYGEKIRIKGDGGSRRGRDQNRPKACFIIHFKFPCSILSLLARTGSWVVLSGSSLEAGPQGTSDRGEGSDKRAIVV